MKNLIISLFLSVFVSRCAGAPLSLPAVFSSHMVLQQGVSVPVWGKARAGAVVRVGFSGQEKETAAAADGQWRVDLDALEASAVSQDLRVWSGSETVLLTNVVVGEVWLCSGQSNMEWALSKTEGADAAIVSSSNPLIRLYHTSRRAAECPVTTVDAEWTMCSSSTVPSFSAVAYYFGQRLSRELDVPIGLIQSAFGGTRIEAWTSPDGFEGIDSLSGLLQIARNMPAMSGNLQEDRHVPTALYNGMIYAHIPFAVRGVIWYQGESNAGQGMLYADKSRALINGWRQLWGYDFPFYFVQIAPYQYGNSAPHIVPRFWEAQANIVKTVPNTGMAVVSDYATLDNIHPPNKKVPGKRLALLALDHTYERDVVSSCPVFNSMLIDGDTAIVHFSSAEGLTTRDGNPPDWFELSGTDGEFRTADAVIDGNTVRLTAAGVSRPVAVRFAWHKLAMPNLINGAGLPAGAFRSTEYEN